LYFEYNTLDRIICKIKLKNKKRKIKENLIIKTEIELAKDMKREIEENGVEDLLIDNLYLNHDKLIDFFDYLKVTRVKFY